MQAGSLRGMVEWLERPEINKAKRASPGNSHWRTKAAHWSPVTESWETRHAACCRHQQPRHSWKCAAASRGITYSEEANKGVGGG